MNSGTDSRQFGYIALTTVLIVSAVGLIFAVTFSKQWRESYEIEEASRSGLWAGKNAESCAEKALIRLRNDAGYSGDEECPGGGLERGTCYIRPIATTTEGEYIIETWGAVDNYKERLQIIISTTSPNFKIKSWQEVKNF